MTNSNVTLQKTQSSVLQLTQESICSESSTQEPMNHNPQKTLKMQETIKSLLQFKFISDLYFSICQLKKAKEKNIEKKNNKEAVKSNMNNLSDLIGSQMFYVDMRTLQRLYKNSYYKISRFWKLSYKQLSLTQQEMQTLTDLWLKKLDSYPLQNLQNYFTSYQGAEYILINQQNCIKYLAMIMFYLHNEQGQIDLYNFLFDMVLRWICNMSQQLKRKRLTLLYEAEEEFSTMNIDQQEDDPLLQKLHQISIKNNMNLLTEQTSALYTEIENTNHFCCLSFVYPSTVIISNRFLINKRADGLILMEYPREFINLEGPLKEASSALLNNNGGFIFIGFKKHLNYYLPDCPIKYTDTLIAKHKSDILAWLNTSLGPLKSLGLEATYKNIKVDFIPIFKSRKFDTMKKQIQNQAYAEQGEFVWKITVFPDKISKLLVHPIAGKFFDLNQEEETFHQIKDSKDSLSSKDLIYQKLREKTQNFGIFVQSDPNNKEQNEKIQKMTAKNNNPKIINHIQNCTVPEIGAFWKDPSQQSVSTSQVEDGSREGMKISSADQPNLAAKKKPTTNNQQEGTKEFKHINLIVLQNKKIKEDCENFLLEKKVSLKIEKLETNLKKLSKTTYVIHHYKKYEEMNTYLMEFKKQFNSNKKIILISAEKSVYIETILGADQLQTVGRMLQKEFPHVLQKQEIMYVEEKEKQGKSFFKADTKMAGIYLYFILSELDVKSDVKVKMKNVPQNLLNKLVPLNRAIDEKIAKNGKNHPIITSPQRYYTEEYYTKEFFLNTYQILFDSYKQSGNYDDITLKDWIQTNFKQYVQNTQGDIALRKLLKLIKETNNEWFYSS